jgi:23S rRNA A2030 N6-methylase RlmJ
MTYQHATKAGNPGDVIKHALWAELLSTAPAPAARPLRYMETHAGPAASVLLPGGEWEDGVGTLEPDPGEATTAYERLVVRDGWQREPQREDFRLYPGSALLALTTLRERALPVALTLCEIQPDVAVLLEDGFQGMDVEAFRVVVGDGYRTLRDLLEQDDERPDVVLIDPPTFDAIPVQDLLQRCQARGVTALAWLPIVAPPDRVPPQVDGLLAWARQSDVRLLAWRWPRPDKPEACTRGAALLAVGVDAARWDAACDALPDLNLPPTWGEHARG